MQGFIGTPARLSALRGQCLLRDHHRCVISRLFDMKEATIRFKNAKPGGQAEDDDKGQLAGQQYTSLELAHILPHSLMKANTSHQLESLTT